MTDQNSFDSPKILIDRASHHIDDAESAIHAFFKREPCARIIDIDRETGDQIFKIRLTAKIPGNVAAIVKDATSNLRAALDHAIYASASALGAVNPDKTSFPFGTDANQLKAELGKDKFSHIPPRIRSFLESLAPYPGGNDLLVALNRVRNSSTHRILTPIGFNNSDVSMNINRLQVTNMQMYSKWDATKNEVEYLRLGPGSFFDGQINVSFDVIFNDVAIIGGRSVIGTLREMAAEVSRVVSAIEAETGRILQFQL